MQRCTSWLLTNLFCLSSLETIARARGYTYFTSGWQPEGNRNQHLHIFQLYWGLCWLFATYQNLSKYSYCALETYSGISPSVATVLWRPTLASFNLHSSKAWLLWKVVDANRVQTTNVGSFIVEYGKRMPTPLFGECVTWTAHEHLFARLLYKWSLVHNGFIII